MGGERGEGDLTGLAPILGEAFCALQGGTDFGLFGAGLVKSTGWEGGGWLPLL